MNDNQQLNTNQAEIARLHRVIAQAHCDLAVVLGGADPTPEQPTIAIDPSDVAILAALHEVHPATMGQIDIASRVLLSRRTLGNRLKRLRSHGHVNRPNGARGGDSITESGKGLLK